MSATRTPPLPQRLERSVQRAVLDGGERFAQRLCEVLAQTEGVVHAALFLFSERDGLALAAQASPSGDFDIAAWVNGARHLEIVSTRPAFPGLHAAQSAALQLAGAQEGADPELADALRERGVVLMAGVPVGDAQRCRGGLSLLLAERGGEAPDDWLMLGRLIAHGLEVADLQADKQRLMEQLEQMSATDPLTAAANRRQAELTLVREMERSGRYGTPLSLIMFDVDGLDEVRRQRGAACGERLLKEVARATQAKLRDADVLARWSDETFVVIAPHADAAGALTLAEKLRSTIAATLVPGCGRASATLGLAQLQQTEAPHALLQRVETALLQARKDGRRRSGVAL
jgi:diguanylate cyclase (GGDEF)-like protein